MNQEERNDIAVKIAKLLSKQRPKPDILDCLDILNNLSESFIKEMEENLKPSQNANTAQPIYLYSY